jgi:oxygen-independent coproporphyrinogen-3 oxidase
MYDLPGQTEESWRYSLAQLGDLPIQHLSLYNLTIEPHTAFHKRGVKAENNLRFYEIALQKLEEVGLERYEISAFAKGPEFQSRHNLGYWTGRPFLGLGPSAFSYWEGERFRNIANLNRYTALLKEGKSPVDFREKLEYPANVKELLAVRLRLKEGVDLKTFPPLPDETKAAIEKLKTAGLLEEENTLRLTPKGMLLYDTLASEII